MKSIFYLCKDTFLFFNSGKIQKKMKHNTAILTFIMYALPQGKITKKVNS